MERTSCKPRMTHENFLKRVDEVFPNKEWEVVGQYVFNRTPILVRNKYGDCLISPAQILQGSNPSVRSAINKTEYSINRFREVHGDKYNYDKFVYTGTRKKGEIVCAKHGSFFQDPNTHLFCTTGCRECWKDGISAIVRSTTEQFIEKARKIHGDTYDYSEVDYIHAKQPVSIICKKHGAFQQVPNYHLSGNACVKCGNEVSGHSNFQIAGKDKLCTFYILRCYRDEEEFIKVGITSRTVNERFSSKRRMPYKYEIIAILELFDMEKIAQVELSSKRLLREFTYIPQIIFHGYTECFQLQESLPLLKNMLRQMEPEIIEQLNFS